MKLRFLVLTAIAVIFPGLRLHAGWELPIQIQNQGNEGNILSSSMIMGEHTSASDDYDAQNDMRYTFPPMNNNYVVCYFVHDDWGEHSGNYFTDIRSLQPDNKIWECQIRANNPYSTSFELSWDLNDDIPDCYQPVLHFGDDSIDMLQQSSYSYSSVATYKDFSIELQYNGLLPYQIQDLPALHFSDNQAQSLNLSDYFVAGSGELGFGIWAHADLVQELEVLADSTMWHVYPRPGWIGETTALISVYGPAGDSLNAEIEIERDSNNSPPVWLGGVALQLTQNQSTVFSWAEQIFDADRDSVSLELDGGAYITVEYDEQATEANLIPEPAWKGETEITLQLDDGSNPSQDYTLTILVLPSEPQSPQNLTLEILSDQTLELHWQPVELDISGLPLSGIRYRVLLYADPAATQLILTQQTSDSRLLLDPSSDRVFVRIIALNDEV
jgi:hypothetical protein